MNLDRKFWVRLLWTVLAFVACSIQVRPFLKSLRPPEGGLPDFFQEWASARNRLAELPIYTHQAVTGDLYREALPLKPGTSLHTAIEYNAHPPSSVLLVLPLGYLDFSDAFLIWAVASLLMLGVSIGIVLRQCPGSLTPWAIFPLAALLLWCSGFRQHMVQGQLNLFVLLLFTAAWAADRSERPWLAGALLGAATAIKLVPGFLFLYFLIRRQWRAIAGGAIGFLILTVVTVLVLGPACYRDYANLVLPSLAKYRHDWLNLSLSSFWQKLFNSQGSHIIPLWQNPTLAWSALLCSDALVTALTAWCIWHSRSLRERDLAFSLTITAMLLVSPITWEHYFTLLFLPLFLLWLWTPRASPPRVAFWCLLIALLPQPLLFWLFAFPGVTHQSWQNLTATPRQAVTALSMQTYILMALFLFTMLVLHRSHGEATDDALGNGVNSSFSVSQSTDQGNPIVSL